LNVSLDLGKIVTIIGPRRAGKTWYLFQLMASLEKVGIKREQIFYLNFEDERLDLDGRRAGAFPLPWIFGRNWKRRGCWIDGWISNTGKPTFTMKSGGLCPDAGIRILTAQSPKLAL